MHAIEPYDTTETMGYITTFALFYVPTPQVNQLGVDLHTPASPIYNQQDGSVNTLMSMIVPTFPLIAGSMTSDGAGGPGSDDNPNNQNSGNHGGDAFSGSSGTQNVKSGSVIIGVSCAAGAAMYGAAMFYIARRYKKRKDNHARASSVASGGPAYASGAGAGMWMSGGRGYDRGSRGTGSSQGRSVQTQQISAPVMAENSLGWN